MGNLPRLIIAAPMSGSGKTTIIAGLIAAFAARGMRVAPFKVGPDYIDPSYHALAAGRTCHNLDAWMLPSDLIGKVLARYAQDADLALIEGVMGLFDGYSGRDDTGSSAHIARITDTPILLVLDVRAQARTAAALVQGLRDFDPRIKVAGVIINRVGSEKHAQMVTDAIETHVGLPVVGFLKRDETLHLPERHLGLIPTAEPGRWQGWLDRARTLVSETIDLDRVFELASATPPLWALNTQVATAHFAAPVANARIAVARDAAFSFLYEENLDLLREAGAQIVFFSPLDTPALPQGTQGLYLCGGFPELYATDLSANVQLRGEIRKAADAGMPIYAECGGLMYLTEAVMDSEGTAHAMVGVLPGLSVMTQRLTLGYRTIQSNQDNWLWQASETMRGHEFHYSTWRDRPDNSVPAYQILPDEWQPEPRYDGAFVRNVIASYIHLHFLAYPDLAARFVTAAARMKR